MAGLFGLKLLLLWAGIIGLASCEDTQSAVTTNKSVSTTLPPRTATNANLPSGTSLTVSTLPPRTTTNVTLPSGTSLSVKTSTPRTMTAPNVMSSDTPPTTHKPPLTSTTLNSNSPSAEPNSTTTSAPTAPPASTPPSNTTSKQIDHQANTTQNQTSPPITMPNTTVTPTTQATTQAPPPPQCSYTVMPITFGFRIDMTNSTPGNYSIYITDKGQNKSKDVHFKLPSHEIKHLKPCTEYEHSVAYRDNAGNETLCNSIESKMKTTGMSRGDITEVSCMPGYVCYRSDWDISSSLSTSNNISPEPCKSNNTVFCIKPDYNDICTDLTTTFTSGDCAKTFSLTKNITVADFLNPSEIVQIAPTGLPAEIKPVLPERCTDLTIDYTCQDELSNIKNESELEPFTYYTCTGQIKNNNVPINRTTAIKFRIDCDLTINKNELSATNTSIDLSWTTDSHKCPVLPQLEKLSYDCSCVSPSKHKPSATKTQTGGMCHFAGLDPHTNYECTVQPKYNNKKVAIPTEVTRMTDVGKPEDIPHVTWTNPEHNVVRVTCAYRKRFNGPKNLYTARLYYNGKLQEKKPEEKKCIFDFKDLSSSLEYEVEVFAFNGRFYSNPKTITVTTSYNSTAVIIRLVVFIIISVALVVVVYKFYVQRCRKSRNDVTDDMMLEPTGDYVNVPQHEHSC